MFLIGTEIHVKMFSLGTIGGDIDVILSELRKNAGFQTQIQLANALGLCNRGTIAKWELGITYPRASLLPTLSKLLKVSEGEIIQAITDARSNRKQ